MTECATNVVKQMMIFFHNSVSFVVWTAVAHASVNYVYAVRISPETTTLHMSIIRFYTRNPTRAWVRLNKTIVIIKNII